MKVRGRVRDEPTKAKEEEKIKTKTRMIQELNRFFTEVGLDVPKDVPWTNISKQTVERLHKRASIGAQAIVNANELVELVKTTHAHTLVDIESTLSLMEGEDGEI